MTERGERRPDLSPDWLPDDDTIDAIVDGREVDARFDHLVAFAHKVRSLGDEPAPAPTPALQAILRPDAGESRELPARRPRRTAALAKVAGLGVAAKIGLGASLAAAGVAVAGAGGALPDPAGSRVRSAIEEITPIDFDDPPPTHDPTHGSTNSGSPRHGGDDRARSTTTSEDNGHRRTEATDEGGNRGDRDDRGVTHPPGTSGDNGRRAHGSGGRPDAGGPATPPPSSGGNTPAPPGSAEPDNAPPHNAGPDDNGRGRHGEGRSGQTTIPERSQHPSATAPGQTKHTTTTSATGD